MNNPTNDSRFSVALWIAGQEAETQGTVSPACLDLGPSALLWCEVGF